MSEQDSIKLDLNLKDDNFTVDDLRKAISAAIDAEFVKKLHSAHKISKTVTLQTHKEFPGGGAVGAKK